MRNVIPQAPARNGGGEDRYSTADPTSPDQLAIVWNAAGEAVVATPHFDGSGSYEIDIARLPQFDRDAVQGLRRESQPNGRAVSPQTLFLASVHDHSERTRILALDGEKLAMRDDELSDWLIDAEQQVYLGTDRHPLFETSLEDTACTIARLPNGLVSMTEAPRNHIASLRERIGRVAGTPIGSMPEMCVETPLRCVARYFLSALREGSALQQPGKESEVTAFILIGRAGFSYGLWSPASGLFSEYAFLSPSEISPNGRSRSVSGQYMRNQAGTLVESAETGAGQDVDSYIRHAFDQLFLQLSQEKLERLQLSTYAQIVWAAEPALSDAIAPIAAEYANGNGLEFIRIDAPADEAVASGLLLGSFAFGGASAAGARILPQANLARDILVLADSEEIDRRHAEEIRLKARRNRAVFALLAAPVIVLAILTGVVADLLRSSAMTTFRDMQADSRTEELKPALDRRKAYEANLKWYQEFITQVSRLRRQQPVGIGLLYQLNTNYPFSVDPSFYVSDMKLLPNGSVEIKGMARNKDAIASFLKALEFAGGPESGSRLFSNLAYEVQESSPSVVPTAGQSALPTMTGSALTATNAAPGVIAWSLKGNYLPVVEFAPPDPSKKPIPASQPAAVPNPKPAT